MWKTTQYLKNEPTADDTADDNWDTDPDFVNDVSEQDSRWGNSKTVEGSGRNSKINLDQLRNDVNQEDSEIREKFAHESQKDIKKGFGGKFGVQTDRVDKSAVGFDYHEKLTIHASQKDHSSGFGGKFGIQKDRVDKSAVGWEHHEKVDKHESQKDYSVGFGGKFGIQKDRVDKSAVGWEHHEKVDKHASQKDASFGFGGKFGVQKDRVDASSKGWDYHEKVDKHASQKDGSFGFGGKFGIQKSQDKSAVGWEHHEAVEKHSSQINENKGVELQGRKDKSVQNWQIEEEAPAETQKSTTEIVKGDAKSLRARFENFAKQDENDAKQKLEVERQKRINREKSEKEAAQKAEEDRQAKLKENESLTFGNNDVEKEESSSDEESHVKSPHLNKIGVSVFPVLSPSPPKAQLSVENENVNSPEYVSPVGEHVLKESATQNADEEEDSAWQEEATTTETPSVSEKASSDGGLTAIALYDYVETESDEISFDPDELITHIEMIDEGWWRGECRGKTGLFPANYVKLC